MQKEEDLHGWQCSPIFPHAMHNYQFCVAQFDGVLISDAQDTIRCRRWRLLMLRWCEHGGTGVDRMVKGFHGKVSQRQMPGM
jgi:hypothetical protein